jgi:hypothetical protein
LKGLFFGSSSFLSRTGFFSLFFAGYGGGFGIALSFGLLNSISPDKAFEKNFVYNLNEVLIFLLYLTIEFTKVRGYNEIVPVC